MTDLEKKLNKDAQIEILLEYVKVNNERDLMNVRREHNERYPDRIYILAEFLNVHGQQTGGFYVSEEILFDEGTWPAIINRLQASVDKNRTEAQFSLKDLPDQEFGGATSETVH